MTTPPELQFPSARDELERRVAAARPLTAHQRLMASLDTLAAVEALSTASGRREAQLEFHRQIEAEGNRRMAEFLAKHVAPSREQS